MIIPGQQISDNARVKLRDGVSPNFYGGFGLPGHEGWIREHREEKYGYPQVLIEWDKDHWAYNGQPDGWTWEGHFELVEEQVMGQDKQDIQEALRGLALRFADDIASAIDGEKEPEGVTKVRVQSEPPTEPEDGPISEVWDISRNDEGDQKELSYGETLEEAMRSASDAEGFMLIAVKKISQGGVAVLAPVAYHAANDLKASLLCHLQMSHLASGFTDRMVNDVLIGVYENDEEANE